MNNMNIEVEGKELAIRNSNGDIVIIPKDKANWVKDKIKNKCTHCIDEYVSTLPILSDYAQDGSLFPNWNKLRQVLNPKNWWVPDYSDMESKADAYKEARKNGELEYIYKGVRYNTKYKGTPEQQLRETGITDKQLQSQNFVHRRLTNNVRPLGYADPYGRVYDAVIKNQVDPDRKHVPNSRIDAYNIYMGLPQEHNTFDISKYKPSKGKNNTPFYYKRSDKGIMANYDDSDWSEPYSEYMLGYINKYGELIPEDQLIRYDDVAGNYTINLGRDEHGKYISYYDKWDLNPFSLKNHVTGKEITTDIGKPFEIYDRIYYRENPKYTRNYKIEKRNIEAELDIIDNFLAGNFENSNLTSKQAPGTSNLTFFLKNGTPWHIPKNFKNILEYREHLASKLNKLTEKPVLRQYYSDKELLELDVNKRNFDTLALQKELSNRGYKLPKSTKSDGSLDGIWGEEIKNALLDYQNKNRTISKFQYSGRIPKRKETFTQWGERIKKLNPNFNYLDNSEYNYRGAYEGGLEPQLVINEDGTKEYHLDSRNPITGEILKSENHPTFRQALEEDMRLGYLPVRINGKIYTFDRDSKEYADLYNSGRLMNYDEASDTYIAPPLKEYTVTAKNPDWIRYQKEYMRNNPMSEFINQYLTPFARSLGNSETNYPKRLDEEYARKALDYASQQIIKNKPQNNLSRVDWLNSLTDKEEELVKRNPKYQSSIWEDTKRGLMSMMESNPLQTAQNILNSPNFSNREKLEMLKDYAEHPVISKL